ncbi:MAG: hypothetical protein J5895_00890 [Alphaproteobacteria bacterium]|nr:hypothetical protein [Alphaproteobacteria bacterium]
MGNGQTQKSRSRADTISSFEKQKNVLRALKAQRKNQTEAVSGVVVASKIAQSIEDGDVVSPITPKLGKQLADSVQKTYLVQNDVDILTTSELKKFEPGKMVLISFPGNATSLTNAKGNPVEEKITKSAAQDGIDSFLKFIQNEVQIKSDQCEFVACYYSHKNNFFVEDFNERGIPHKSTEKFATAFDNLISKNGKKIDVDEAVKNMRGVIMRGQCFGTCIISELEQCLFHKLALLGYSQQECIKILSAPTALFSSSPVDLKKQPQFFRVFAYANCADTLIPTIKGAPTYQKLAGFTNEEIASRPCRLKTVHLRENFRLVLCSRLDFPDTAEMEKTVAKRLKNPDEEKIHQRVSTILKGHAFSAVTNPIKPSAFMSELRAVVQKGMASSVHEVNSLYRLEKLNITLRHFKAGLTQKNIDLSLQKQENSSVLSADSTSKNQR